MPSVKVELRFLSADSAKQYLGHLDSKNEARLPYTRYTTTSADPAGWDRVSVAIDEGRRLG